MATTTLRFACQADTWIREPNLGAGRSNELPIGLSGGNVHRALLRFAPIDWAGLRIARVISAEIHDRNTGEVHVTRGASPRIVAWRILEAWTEGTATALSSANVTRWDNMPGRTATGAGDSGITATTSGTFAHIPCTDIVKAWAPTSVQGGGGQPNRGILLKSFDEGATTRTTELYSRESSFDPVLVLVVETNSAPEAPINLDPSGDAAIGAIAAGRITFRGERVDPDAADYITAVEVAVHADGATDGAPGSAIVSAITTYTTKPVTFAATLASDALTVGTHYRWRGRTRDKSSAWGPWSSFADGRFIADSVPGVPINLAIDTTSLAPHFFGSIDDPDGDDLGAVRVVVYQDTTAGALLKWDSGFNDTSGTRFEVTYGGTPLEVGMTGLRWAAQVRDEWGGEGPLSAYQSWTPAAVTGPDAMSPIDVETKQDDLTPDLTIGHSSAFDAYELEVARFADGSGTLWDVPVTGVASTTSTTVAYAGTALTWGRTYYWRAKVRVAGITWTEWSAWYPFYVNALPLAPAGSVDDSVDSGDHFTVVTATATLRFPFSDPDMAKGYAEAPTRRVIEIEKLDGTPFGASPYNITVGITDTMVTGTLVAETVYRARCRYEDSSGQSSPWSAYVNLKRSVAPVIAEDDPVNVEDPNPRISWTYASSPAKAQAGYQVLVFADATGELVHDSGFVASDAHEYEVPGEILQDATDYRYEVTAYDTDLLTDEAAGGPWTTDFGTPNPITGLTGTASSGDSSIVLAWDVTDLDPELFWRYYIYRLGDDGLYARIGSVDDPDAPTFTDVGAPHGTSTYVVTVSNGWVESSPVTVAVTLNLEWAISAPDDASLRFALFNVTAYRAKHELQADAYQPLGRSFPVVVSGQQLAPAGTLAIMLGSDEGEMVELLKRAARVTPFVYLKDPFGSVLSVRLGSIDQDRAGGGTQVLAVPYWTVA